MKFHRELVEALPGNSSSRQVKGQIGYFSFRGEENKNLSRAKPVRLHQGVSERKGMKFDPISLYQENK